MSNGNPPKRPLPNAKPIEIEQDDANKNLNNMDIFKDQEEQTKDEIPIPVLIQLIVIALESLDKKGGSSLKDIRKLLFSSGLVDQTTDLRRAMIAALKQGEIARPMSAVKAGVYGLYVKGDGIPIHLKGNRKSRKSGIKGNSRSPSTSNSKKSTARKSKRSRKNRKTRH